MDLAEIRKDYFLDRYVIISQKRGKRPLRKIKKDVSTAEDICNFCPEKIAGNHIISQVKDEQGKWLITTISNKYPALSQNNPKAYGAQEVIVETPKHNKEIHELSIEHIVKIFNVYIERFERLRNTKGIKYVLVFKNEGGKAGASVSHSHSQIIAMPLVPPNVRVEYDAYTDYRLENKTCPYCDIIKKEEKSKRVIAEDDYFFALAPYASQSPFGVWFLPKRHIKDISEMSESEKESLARMLKKILAKLDEIDVSYNYFVHSSVNEEDYHMHIKLEPRPNVWAGLELGTGIIMHSVFPEDAAKFYQRK